MHAFRLITNVNPIKKVMWLNIIDVNPHANSFRFGGLEMCSMHRSRISMHKTN